MQCELLQDVPSDDLRLILSFFQQRRIFRGQTFIHKGEPGEEMFIIHSGRAVVKIAQKNICTLSKGDIIGEVCLTQPGSARTADLLSETDLVLYGITSDVMDRIARSYPQTVGILWKNIARIEGRRLRNTNDRLEDVTRELAEVKKEKSELEEQLFETTQTGFSKIKRALVSAK